MGKQEVSLEEEYKKYEEQQRIRKVLEDSFADTEYEGLIGQIMNLIEAPKPLKILYLDSLKQFGRRGGLEIYHKVKQMI